MGKIADTYLRGVHLYFGNDVNISRVYILAYISRIYFIIVKYFLVNYLVLASKRLLLLAYNAADYCCLI